MSQLFKCPSCSASLDYDGGDHATVRCAYCGNTVIVPDSMRSKAPNVSTLFTRTNRLKEIVDFINAGRQSEAVQLYSETFNVSHEEAQAAVNRLASGLSLAMNQMQVQSISMDPSIQTYRSNDKTGRNIGCLVLGIILFTVFIVVVTTVVPLVASGAAVWSVFSSEDPFSEVGEVFSTLEAAGATVESGSDPGSLASRATPTPPKPGASPTPDAAELIFSFGSLGIAPGQLNDARTLALDSQGNIYVADRDSGRLQVFNAGGQVQNQWTMSEERFIDGMAIDRAGHLYTIESSDIYRYDLASGQQLNQITYPQGIVSFSSIATTVNNELVAVNWIAGQIIRFDANGSPGLVIPIENVPDGIAFDVVAVDGQGNIYVIGRAEDVLGDQQDVVFKFTAEGQYVTRFGKSGGEPGSFRSPQSIAVDGQGRIYVGDIFGVHIFDNTGSFLDFFPVEGALFDMKFSDQGELLITNREKIFKFAIHVK